MNRNSLYQEALQGMEKVNKTKHFKLLPGDPVKGTIYSGFINSVEIKIIENKESINFGREMLVIKMIVIDEGEYKGWTEVYNRLLNPASTDELTADGIKELIEKKIRTLENSEKPPKTIIENEIKEEVKKEHKKYVLSYLRDTLQILRYIGTDISSADEKIMLASAAHCRGNQIIWKVYNAKNNNSKRRVFIQDPANYSIQNTPNLFKEALPNESMVNA